jgi:hypothetical protein
MDLLVAQFNNGHLSENDIKDLLNGDFPMWDAKLKSKFKVDPNGNGQNYVAWKEGQGGLMGYAPHTATAERKDRPVLKGHGIVVLRDGEEVECKSAFQILEELVADFHPEKVDARLRDVLSSREISLATKDWLNVSEEFGRFYMFYLANAMADGLYRASMV